jgi:hypothetical protein
MQIRSGVNFIGRFESKSIPACFRADRIEDRSEKSQRIGFNNGSFNICEGIMKTDYLKNIKELVPKICIVFSVIFAVSMVVKGGSVLGDLSRARALVEDTAKESQGEIKVSEETSEATKAVVEQLRKKNLFSPVPEKKKAVEKVSGIFGDEALINGKWYKAGDKIEEAEILALEATLVRIKIDGVEKNFYPLTVNGSDANANEERPSPGRAEDRSGRGGGERPSRGDRPERGGGRDGASWEEQRERYRNMSEDERREFRDSMRERFRQRD